MKPCGSVAYSQGDITTVGVHRVQGNNKPYDPNHERNHDMEGTLSNFVGMPCHNESDHCCESPWRCTKKKCDGTGVSHRGSQRWEVCVKTQPNDIASQCES